MTDRPGDTIGEGELAKLLELAVRTELEAEKWYGKPMYDGLLKIAYELRQRARTASSAREA